APLRRPMAPDRGALSLAAGKRTGRSDMDAMETPDVGETVGLTKRCGERGGVDRVDLRVPRGSAFGYLGPNGAGKTTLIRMLLGLTRPDAGSMRLLGRAVPEEGAAGGDRG